MFLPIIGFSTSIPSNYEEIKRRLRQLGLAPTGNPEIDKSRLKQAIDNKIEKFVLHKKEIDNKNEIVEKKLLEEERLGAQTLGEHNRFFFKI